MGLNSGSHGSGQQLPITRHSSTSTALASALPSSFRTLIACPRYSAARRLFPNLYSTPACSRLTACSLVAMDLDTCCACAMHVNQSQPRLAQKITATVRMVLGKHAGEGFRDGAAVSFECACMLPGF